MGAIPLLLVNLTSISLVSVFDLDQNFSLNFSLAEGLHLSLVPCTYHASRTLNLDRQSAATCSTLIAFLRLKGPHDIT
jgi:hypothetical protein